MGILDDAIREHLELKRRHGVAEDELQRQEDEALGPARRDVAQQHEDTEAAPGQAATAGDAPPAAEEAPVEPPPVADEEPVVEPDLEPDPHPALGETQPHGFEAIEDEEAEPFDHDPDDEDVVVSEGEDEGEDAEEDVLEDTPDFLQETPEHDRLWFEQKPPRDFDFD